jgi:homoserine dehydrogenase
VQTAYYLRLLAHDKPGVLGQIATILGDAGISIEAMLQKESEDDKSLAPIILLTHPVKERNMNGAIAKIESLPAIAGPVVRIRVENLS